MGSIDYIYAGRGQESVQPVGVSTLHCTIDIKSIRTSGKFVRLQRSFSILPGFISHTIEIKSLHYLE
jgi:hypothetical protein